ncbi:MAG: anti-sigma-factor antagonist [Nocardioides sp.]|uniref:STAS domain-containing protein n=1 Tax=Nocardioides sp. TaxID=35761 RepID=UPI00260ED8A1|nr:STAS domain-containing protein [Nocardioides sp.]MCW2834546.1 anti-sigma-factor antagonist [Nocardioides sp.]
MNLEVATRFAHGYTVVTPRGEIDLSTVDTFREVLNELLIQGQVHILIEMDETSFFDSLGFGALVGARRKAQAFNGSLGIVCSNERILRLFQITALDRVFTITKTVQSQPARDVIDAADSAAPTVL